MDRKHGEIFFVAEETSGGSLIGEINSWFEQNAQRKTAHVWSHMYGDGDHVPQQIIEDALACDKWSEFEGSELDFNGHPADLICGGGDSVIVIASYDRTIGEWDTSWPGSPGAAGKAFLKVLASV